MYFIYRTTPLIILLLLGFYTGCTSEASTEPDDEQQGEIATMIHDGWEKFINQDYDGAISIFSEAATKALKDEDQARIRTGWGWSLAYNAKGKGFADLGYLESIQQLERAMSRDTTYLDSYSGACLVYNVRNDYEKSVETGETVIAKKPDYEFKPVENNEKLLDYRHIRLAIAESAFYLGQYNTVVTHLDVIDPGVSHSALDPEGLLERIRVVYDQLD
jgi:tetratricopeptide (TPR) repeat protein